MTPALPPGPEPVYRLHSVLVARKAAEGSFVQLAQAIAAANPAPGNEGDGKVPPPLDRRKLRRLLEDPETVSLNLKEFRALDRYLDRFNEGLSHRPILDKPNLLQQLAGTGNITFLLGAKPTHDHGGQFLSADLSRWDTLAMAEVQREVYRVTPSVHFDLEDVVLRGSDEGVQAPFQEDWCGQLREDGPSLVSLGSWKACHATESLLSQMFGVPRCSRRKEHKLALPFHFIWPKLHEPSLPSAFTMTAEDIRSLDPDAADKVQHQNTWVIRVGDQVYAAEPRNWTDARTYGIIAAQRRRCGQVWMVVAGLSGTATYACSLAVPSIMGPLPEPVGPHSPVLWCAVEVLLEASEPQPAAVMRAVAQVKMLREPQLWQPRSAA